MPPSVHQTVTPHPSFNAFVRLVDKPDLFHLHSTSRIVGIRWGPSNHVALPKHSVSDHSRPGSVRHKNEPRLIVYAARDRRAQIEEVRRMSIRSGQLGDGGFVRRQKHTSCVWA